MHPSKPSRTLGPLEAIWLNVQGMRTEEQGPVRAAYRQHQWDVDGLSYSRLDCTAKVKVRFRRKDEHSAAYGPFERFSSVNGLAYGDDRVIACLDYKQDEWLYYDSGYHWPVMAISDLAAKR